MYQAVKLIGKDGETEPLAEPTEQLSAAWDAAMLYLFDNDPCLGAGVRDMSNGKVYWIESTKLGQRPLSSISTKNAAGWGTLLGGCVCFLIGVVLMFVSLWSFIFFVPFFLVAFILSIVAIAQARVAGGVFLLIGTIIIPPILFSFKAFPKSNLAELADARDKAHRLISAKATRISQDKEEVARQKAIWIEGLEKEIVQRENELAAAEKKVDDAEKEIIQTRKKYELKAQAKFNGSETAREVARTERGQQLIQEFWDGLDEAEEKAGEALKAQRKGIAENWRYVEYLRSLLQILKSIDDPYLASELIAIEVESYNNITEQKNNYEKIEAKQERERERNERASKRKLERNLEAIERKYK